MHHQTLTMQLSKVILSITLFMMAAASISSSVAHAMDGENSTESGTSTDLATNETLTAMATVMAQNGTELPEEVKKMTEDVTKDGCVSFVFHLNELAGESELLQSLIEQFASAGGNATEMGKVVDGSRRLAPVSPWHSGQSISFLGSQLDILKLLNAYMPMLR